MTRSCSEYSKVSEELHTHINESVQDEVSSTKLTKVVAAKVSSELYERILATAQYDEVTTSCAVRRLLMRALAEDAGNLAVIDSSRERGRRS